MRSGAQTGSSEAYNYEGDDFTEHFKEHEWEIPQCKRWEKMFLTSICMTKGQLARIFLLYIFAHEIMFIVYVLVCRQYPLLVLLSFAVTSNTHVEVRGYLLILYVNGADIEESRTGKRQAVS